MKNFTLFLNVFFYSIVVNAAIIITPIDAPFSSQEKNKVMETLRDYTGLSPKYFLDKAQQNDFSFESHDVFRKDLSFAEVHFVKKELKRCSLEAQVRYVPNTLWDLHTLSQIFNDKKESNFWNKLRKAGFQSDSAKKSREQKYFQYSEEIAKKLKDQEDFNCSYFLELSKEYVESIAEKKNYESDEWFQALKVFEYTSEERKKFKNGKNSVILRCVEEEFKADQENQVTLIRATKGHRGYLDSLIDNPLNLDPIFNKDVKIGLKNGGMVWTKGLSYGASLLGGTLFDEGACSFHYYMSRSTNASKILYMLPVDKIWLFTKGFHLFYLPRDVLTTEAISQNGECFHPRLLSLKPSSTLQDAYKNVQSYYETTTNIIPIQDNFSWAPFSDVIEENSEKKKLMQFILLGNHMLSQARIIGYEGKTIPRKLDLKNATHQVIETIYRRQTKLTEEIYEASFYGIDIEKKKLERKEKSKQRKLARRKKHLEEIRKTAKDWADSRKKRNAR